MVSVLSVVASAAIAWAEGNWTRRAELGMGFANHGGMWSDLVLLSLANAVIVPHLAAGVWIVVAGILASAAAVAVHAHWYHPTVETRGDHMWPTHTRRVWWRDLSWAGWAHVLYVAGELTLLAGFLIHPMPEAVVLFVLIVLTLHVPIGLLQPRYFLTGHIATVGEQPLLLPCLAALWIVATTKM